MVGIAQTVTCSTLTTFVAVVIQVCAGTKSTTFAGEKQTAGLAATGLDLRDGFGEVFEHLTAHCIHHFRVVELQHRDAVDEFKTHAFHINPLSCQNW